MPSARLAHYFGALSFVYFRAVIHLTVAHLKTVSSSAIISGLSGLNVEGNDGRRANVSFAVNHRAKTVSIKAKRNLRNGEELFLSYGRDYRMNDGSRYVTASR